MSIPKGHIYVWCQQGSENFIFKSGPSGQFDRAFGRSTEAPGEIAALSHIRINEQNEIVISGIYLRSPG